MGVRSRSRSTMTHAPSTTLPPSPSNPMTSTRLTASGATPYTHVFHASPVSAPEADQVDAGPGITDEGPGEQLSNPHGPFLVVGNDFDVATVPPGRDSAVHLEARQCSWWQPVGRHQMLQRLHRAACRHGGGGYDGYEEEMATFHGRSDGIALRQPILAAIVLTVCLAGCVFGPPGQVGTNRDAERYVDQWLREMADPTDADRGWALLHPLTQQRLFGSDVDRYITSVEADDWTDFSWRIETQLTRWDGTYSVKVDLMSPSSVPPFLTDMGLLHFTSIDGAEAEAGVRIDSSIQAGILAP